MSWMNAKCADKYKMAPPSIMNYNWNFWTNKVGIYVIRIPGRKTESAVMEDIEYVCPISK